MRSHPIATIHFEVIRTEITDLRAPGRITRHWYHVPREGDWVSLIHPLPGDESVAVEGTVKKVLWGEDSVVVRLR